MSISHFEIYYNNLKENKGDIYEDKGFARG